MWSPDGTEIAYGLISGGRGKHQCLAGDRRLAAQGGGGLARRSGASTGPPTAVCWRTAPSEDGAGGPFKVFLCRLATGEVTALTDPLPVVAGRLQAGLLARRQAAGLRAR